MGAFFSLVGVVLLTMQTGTAKQARPADIALRQLAADRPTCACREHQRLAWSCGEMVFVLVEERTLVRFGRKAAPVRPRRPVLLWFPTGRYSAVSEEGHVEFAIEKLPDAANLVRLVTRRDSQPVATLTAIVEGDDRLLWCASSVGLVDFASVRDLPLTPEP